MKKASVLLCTVFVILLLAILIGLLFPAPDLVRQYGPSLGWNERIGETVLFVFYCSALPAAAALGCLLMLLYNIRSDRPFSKRTAILIGIISWCCAAVAVIAAIGAIRYFPLFFLAVIMAFMFLIVRVVRMCFLKAAELNEENHLTI